MYSKPSYDRRVKISLNVDALFKVYRIVHLEDEHKPYCVISTFTGQNESTVFDW